MATTGTIRRDPSLNEEQAAETFRGAMRDSALFNERAIIDELLSMNNEQRQQVSTRYRSMYSNEDLFERLKGGMSGNLREVVVALILSSADYDAYCLHQALQVNGGAITNNVDAEEAMIDILCTRNKQQIMTIRDVYHRTYNSSLEQDVEANTSIGELKPLFSSLSKAQRHEGAGKKEKIDQKQGHADAQALFNVGENRWFVDNAAAASTGANVGQQAEFVRVFVSSSPAQFRVVEDEYRKISSIEMEDAIRSESRSANFKQSFRAIIQSAVREPDVFYANRLYYAMRGVGAPNENTLLRIMVSRSEIDLENIKATFLSMYKTPLGDMIQANTNPGEMQRCLLAICDPIAHH